MGKKCEAEAARSWNLEAFSDENEDFAMANSRAQGTQPRLQKQGRGKTWHFMASLCHVTQP